MGDGGEGMSGSNPRLNLLKTNVGSDGYPVVASNSKSLSELFGSAYEVNHLFIEQTYYESGYYEFDSTQNYAYLNGRTRTFKVYDQLGTVDKGKNASKTLWHGQFYPYNDLDPNYICEYQTNLNNIHGNPLNAMNPRYGEKLYGVPNTPGRRAALTSISACSWKPTSRSLPAVRTIGATTSCSNSPATTISGCSWTACWCWIWAASIPLRTAR